MLRENVGIQELQNNLENTRFSIYGIGHVAKKFYSYLSKRNLVKNIDSFIVTKRSGETEFEGVCIKEIDEIEMGSNTLICIAVHESLLGSISEQLNKKKVINYIWIYPYLVDLVIGNPIYTNRKEQVSSIVRNNLLDYRIAIRYHAIECYYNRNISGEIIYKKAMSIHCVENTVNERLKNFYSLIKEWEVKGYNKGIVISITENKDIIDGHHRIALAKYFGQENIRCDIYSGALNLMDFHGKKAMLTKDTLIQADFSMEEIRLLDQINRKLGK